MALPPARLHHLELCAGIGGLGLGLRMADPRICTVGYVERETYCAAVLVARMENKTLDCAPIWDELGTFDGRAWRGYVDIISAGFPCQPWSCAGKRAGIADARWLWPDIAGIVRMVRPGRVFLENVPGLIRGGLGPVLHDLAEMGFDAVWGCFRASDAGAPHKRERIFILADAAGRRTQWKARRDNSARKSSIRRSANMADAERGRVGGRGCAGLDPQGGQVGQPADWAHPANEPRHGSQGLADAAGGGLGKLRQPPRGDGQPDRGDPQLADAASLGGREPDNAPRAKPRQGPRKAAGGRSGDFPAFPPGPSEFDAWNRILAAFPGLAPAVEPGLRGMVDGIPDRLDRLRALGNAVVPAQAALAYKVLNGILDTNQNHGGR